MAQLQFVLRESQLATLEAKIARLNRTAAKLGVEPVTVKEEKRWFVEGKAFTGVVSDGAGGTTLIPSFAPGHVAVSLVAEGESPKLPGGWRLAARLEHDPEIGTIVLTVPGEAVPAQFHDAVPTCDHCGTRRRRKITFLLRSEDQRIRQVGSTCVRDFLGHAAPEDILRKLSWFGDWIGQCRELADEWEDEERWGGDSKFAHLRLEPLLGLIVRLSHLHGWCSKQAVRDAEERGERKVATIDQANHLIAKGAANLSSDERDQVAVTDEDLDEARAAIAWAEDLDADNDFLRNIQKIAAAGICSARTAGIAAAIPAAFARHQERELAKKRDLEGTLDEHWGVVGAKGQQRDLEIVSIRELESQWGVVTLFKFRDGDGRTFVWFASRPGIAKQFEVGQIKIATFGIKDHKQFRDVAQTVITRVTLRDAA